MTVGFVWAAGCKRRAESSVCWTSAGVWVNFLQRHPKCLRPAAAVAADRPQYNSYHQELFFCCRLKVKSGSIQHYQHFLHASLNGYS